MNLTRGLPNSFDFYTKQLIMQIEKFYILKQTVLIFH